MFLKAENLQRGGAFKFRGAYNKIASLPPGVDVVAFSSGNHAQAVALASGLLGRKATILMPTDAPELKVRATRGYGAEIVTYDRYAQDRDELGVALAEERGLALVKPFDDPLIMAGAGTAALELLAEVGELDVLVTPVGGGGLVSGSAIAARDAGVARVVGVEPAAGDDVRQSLARGERVRIDVPRTIADGLQTPEPGVHTFEVIQQLVDEDAVTLHHIAGNLLIAFVGRVGNHLPAVRGGKSCCLKDRLVVVAGDADDIGVESGNGVVPLQTDMGVQHDDAAATHALGRGCQGAAMIAIGGTDDHKVMQWLGMQTCQQVRRVPGLVWPAAKHESQQCDRGAQGFEAAQLGPL